MRRSSAELTGENINEHNLHPSEAKIVQMYLRFFFVFKQFIGTVRADIRVEKILIR